MELRTATSSDLPAIRRTWQECGWVDEDEAAHIEQFLEGATAVVAVVDGEAEACSTIHRGTLRHTGTDLDAAVVSSVTTSRVGRKQGLARASLRRVLHDAARDGAVVAVLGMFEQGFYDTLGFGTGTEMVFHRFDPASLPASLPYRRPVRLAEADVEAVDVALSTRARGHGGVTIPGPGRLLAEIRWWGRSFGLGYRDDEGAVTHFLWATAPDEHGPYRVTAWGWRTDDQLRELFGLLRSLGDQVRWVTVPEPWCLQVVPLIGHPGRQRLRTAGTPNAYRNAAEAWWQLRVLDLAAAVGAFEATTEVAFDLTVTDPLAEGEDAVDGAGGAWHVSLGATSTAERGHAGDVPHLRCTINTFSRLWAGVRSPSVVLATDGIACDDAMVAALDRALVLPRPDVGMDF